MSLRPSKKFFFKMLETDLSCYNYGTGLDAASADMKNFPFFKTNRYIGIDIDEERLKRGVKRHREALGLLADLSVVKLPENCVDVCVSTHTFEHMPTAAQLLMAKNLIDATRTGGCLLCNKVIDEAVMPLEAMLRENFAFIKKVYYRNKLSVWFDKRYLKNERGLVLSGVAYLLYLVEHVTSWTHFSNASVYFVCKGKKTVAPETALNFAEFRVLDRNLWAVL